MPELKKSTDRLQELDVLRGFAALGVMSFHYTTNYALRFYASNSSMLFQFPLGQYGVHLFFMISGFVILMTLEKSAHIFDFVVSRFSKLYPCYWAAILLTSVVIKQFILLPSLRMELPLKSILINLTMMQSWLHVADLDTVYWTLATELSFYFLMSLVFMARGMKYIEIFAFIWLVLMAVNKFYPPFGEPAIFLKSIFDSLLRYGNLFAAGIFFYGLKIKGNKWYRHAGIGLCIVIQYLVWDDLQKEAILPFVFFVGVFYLFVMKRLSFIVQKPLVFFGVISYSLYLIHQDIGYIIIQWLYFFGHNPWLMFFAPALCALLLATLMTYGIEKPVMKFIRQAYKSLKSRP